MLYLKLLGPVHVTQVRDEADKEENAGSAPRFRSRRTIALLGFLASERRPIAREYLAAFFWPDEEPSSQRSNLRRELYNLGKVLPDCWHANSQTICFVPSVKTNVDIDALEKLELQKRWQEAAEFLSGEFLEGLYLSDNPRFENWVLAEREHWRERSQAILHKACDEMTQRGRYSESLTYVRRLLQLAPWDERAHQKVMYMLAWSGKREAAIRQYALCRQALADELGIEPSEDTVHLYQRIQAGQLQRPPAPPPFVEESAENSYDPGSSFVMREQELAWLRRQLDSALAGRGGIAFITGGPGLGKSALMDVFAAKALSARPKLLIARGSCTAYAGVGDPYLPFRDIMVMLCGDVEGRWRAGSISTAHARRLWAALPLVAQALLEHGPGLLDILVPGSILLEKAQSAAPAGASWLESLVDLIEDRLRSTASVEQSGLFEQFSNVVRAMARERPLLLLLDDIQWMDSASVALLFHLARRVAEESSNVLILCAYRPEEITTAQSNSWDGLAKAMGEIRRMFGDVWLSLAWTDELEGRRFVENVLDLQPNYLDNAFRAAMFRRTAGHPLFTVELISAMRERGELLKDENGYWIETPQLDWKRMPARVEAVIEARIQQLPPEYQELLSTASVEGELFTAQVLAYVHSLEEGPLLRLLARHLGNRHGLVKETGAYQTNKRSIARFAFRHALFQEYLYKRLSPAERRLLHGAVAEALEQVYAEDLQGISVQLAQHFNQAGNYDRAHHYFALAADYAIRTSAFDEAITHFTRAIKLEKQLESTDGDLASHYHRRGQAYATTGQFDLALEDMGSALDISRTGRNQSLEWRILIELGKLWSSRDYQLAREFFESALDLARQIKDPAALGRSLNGIGNWYANDENPAKALVFHQEALRLFEGLADDSGLANTLDLLGIAKLLIGDFSASATNYDRAIDLFQKLGDSSRLASSLMGRAVLGTLPAWLTLAPSFAPADPFADFREAAEIARRIGSSPDEAWCAWALALLHTVRGDFGRALETCRRGLQIATSIGHREWLAGNRFAFGVVYIELLQPKKALLELEQGLELAKELQSQYWIHHVTGALAKCYLLLEDPEAARSRLEAVISRTSPMDTKGMRYCWARRAELALIMGEPELALSIADRLISSAAGRQPGAVFTFMWLLKGRALTSLGQTEEAQSLLTAGRDNAVKTQERFLLWRFHGELGRLYQAARNDPAATKEITAARILVDEMAATLADRALADSFQQRAYEVL